MRLLGVTALQYGFTYMLTKKHLAKQAVRKVALGLLLLFVAVVIGTLAVAGLAAALFFQLADLPQLIRPALIMSLLIFLVAGLIGWQGVHRLRSPRKKRAGN